MTNPRSGFTGQQLDTGTWRDIDTGVNPFWGEPEEMFNDRGVLNEPITTRMEGPWGVPYWDGLEDPTAPTGLPAESPNPTYPDESVGGRQGPGAYQAAFRTLGPVRAWGHEPSGGIWGDQSIGRIMRFPANIPERYDVDGVRVGDFRDELAGAIAANNAPVVSDADVYNELVYFPMGGV